MEKLRKYIETWLEGKTVRGVHITPIGIYDCVDAYNAMVNGRKFEFINSDVKNALEKCGIEVRIRGVGWECG